MFRRVWQNGTATIVGQRPHEGLYHMKGHTGIYRNIWDYVADVTPDDGTDPFRASFTELFEGFDGRQPSVGEQAPVRYDKDRKVELDRKALEAEYRESHDAKQDAFAALAAAAPGTAPDAAPTAGAEAMPLPGSGGLDTVAAIKRARAAGDLAEVDRLKAEYRSRNGL